MRQDEPLTGQYHFLLEIAGVQAGTFQSIEVRPPPPHLKAPTDSMPTFQRMPRPAGAPVRPGTGPAQRIPPQGLKWRDITLKRGSTQPGGPAASRDDLGHKVAPTTHKVTPVSHKVNPFSHKVNPLSHKVSPASHKVNPGAAVPGETAGARSRLDQAALKWQPAVLVLVGFSPSGRSIPSDDTVQPGRVVLEDPRGAPVARWSFSRAWPCKWYVPETTSGRGAALMVEGIRRE